MNHLGGSGFSSNNRDWQWWRKGLPPCSAMWTFGMMMTSPAAKYQTTHTHSLPSWVLRHLHHTIYHGCNIGKLRRIKIRRPVLFTSTWVFNGIWIWNFQQFQHLPKNRSGFHVVKITSPWVVPWVDIFWHILTAMPWEDPHWIVLGGQIWHLFGSEPQPRWGE